MKTLLFLAILSPMLLAQSGLETKLIVTSVTNSKNNQFATNEPRYQDCSDSFKGTYAGNGVTLLPSASGGSGSYEHQIVYTLSNAYTNYQANRSQFNIRIKDGRVYTLWLPDLRDEVPYVQQSVLLLTTDRRTGETRTSNLMFTVSRPVILKQSQDPEKTAQNCHHVYPAIEGLAGVLSNSTTNSSQLTLRQGHQTMWQHTAGTQWGFYFSPLAFTEIGNIFSIYRNHFNSVSRQVIETVEVSNTFNISPGDYVQIYEQKTRYVTSYDAIKVDSCGNTERLEGDFFIQWWGVSYHAVPVSASADERLPVELIGSYPENYCPESLTPSFETFLDDHSFVRTY